MTRCTMVGVKGRPSPLARPRAWRMAAISAQVWWSSRLSISAMVVALVCRIFQAGSGTGRVRVRCWPPARRACAVMVSLVLGTGTSVSSSRAMRLRARRGGGVVPDAGQVGDELGDPVFLGLGERAGVPFSGLVVGGLGVGQGA